MRVIGVLRMSQLRTGFLRGELRALSASAAAEALEEVCRRADLGEGRAMIAMHTVVELLSDPSLEEARDALRADAQACRHLSLGRLLRRPFVAPSRAPRASRSIASAQPVVDDDVALTPDEPPPDREVPDYGKGRPLTLGERKSLARRPPPELLPKILGDPHPEVIRNLLASPRLTEDDVVRIATRRPHKGEVLLEVARHPRWCHRTRVRAALVLNPSTPTELAVQLVSLLRRPELVSVVASTGLHKAVRAAASERLERLPPMRARRDDPIQ